MSVDVRDKPEHDNVRFFVIPVLDTLLFTVIPRLDRGIHKGDPRVWHCVPPEDDRGKRVSESVVLLGVRLRMTTEKAGTKKAGLLPPFP